MRRSHLTALAAVSIAALLSATSTLAVTPPTMNLGFLKPQEQWKVGTVNADGASYCAMVNKFEKQVVLAVARNPEGFGSLAVDFREAFFEPGEEYEVALKIDGGRTRTLVGRASSDRSVVVQVGQDAKFFESLNANGNLGMSFPTIDVSFALRKFSSSYKNLVKCADQLVSNKPKVEQTDLAPIDREVKKLTDERTNITSAEQEVRQLQGTLKQKTSGFDDMEAQLEEEAKAEAKKAETRIGKLDDRKEDLAEKLADEKAEVAGLEEKKQKVERKLIASMGKDVPEADVAASGLTAQQLEQQQVAVSKFLQAEEEAKKTAWLKEQTAALEAQKAKEAEAHVAAFKKQQDELAKKAARLQAESDKIAAARLAEENNKAAKAALVVKQAQIAAVETQKAQGAQELTRKLADTQTDYQSRIAALESERDSLKRQLDSALAQNFNRTLEPAAGGEDVAVKLAASEKEKAELADRVAKLEKQKSLLEATITSKQSETAKGGDAKAVSTLQAELVELKSSHAATMASLQKQLTERTAKYDELKKQFDGQQAQLALVDADKASADKDLTEKHGKIIAQLAEKQAVISRLEGQLKDIETQRAAETERAAKAQGELEAARAQIAELRTGLGGDQQRLASLQTSLEKQKAELDKKAADQMVEAKRLEAERVEIATLRETLNKGSQDAAAAREKLASISSGKSYDDAEIRSLKNDLAQQRADLDRQAISQSQQAEWIEREKASIARAKSGIPAEKLMASERAELDEARMRIAQLEQTLAQSQSRVADIDAGVQEGRAVAAAGNGAAIAELEKRAAELDAREKQLAADRQAFESQRTASKGIVGGLFGGGEEEGSPVAADGALDAAKAEIERLKAENAKLAGRLFIKDSTPAAKAPAPTAAELNSEEPAAGGDAPVSAMAEERAPSGWFGNLGYGNKKSPVAEEAPVRTKPVTMAKSDVFDVPAVPTTPVVAERVASVEGVGAGNRAAAFLDRIMTHHRKGGAPAAALEDSEAFEAPEYAYNKEEAAPAVQAPAKTQLGLLDRKVNLPKAGELSTIETAAGTPDRVQPLSRPSFVPAETVSAKPAYVPQAPVVQETPVVERSRIAPAADPASIATVLEKSGIRGAVFNAADAAPGETVAQWTAGNINGMFEQSPSTGRGFDAEVQAYLARYREDCPQGLAVSVGPAEAGPSGSVAVADLSCEAPGNSYTSSVVFIENASGFGALLHTGYPQDAAKVRSFSDNIAYTLGTVGGVTVDPAPVAKKAEAVLPQKQPLKFRIAIDAPASFVPADAVGHGDFETVVVQ